MKLSNDNSDISVSLAKSALSILEYGLPMCLSQFFIRSTSKLVPCIWPLTVPCSVFLHQPLTLNLFAASRVYFLKLTPVQIEITNWLYSLMFLQCVFCGKIYLALCQTLQNPMLSVCLPCRCVLNWILFWWSLITWFFSIHSSRYSFIDLAR